MLTDIAKLEAVRADGLPEDVFTDFALQVWSPLGGRGRQGSRQATAATKRPS